MRSGELARLAGTTTRALRHYHQVGVLAEPERRHNGYRDYGVRDLIRVLRIKRLAALGIALETMPRVLDDVTGDTAYLLDDLDAELARQIERLDRQRALIALLREHGTPLDLPPELAPFLKVAAGGLPPDLAQFDRDQTVLLAHLAGDAELRSVARLYEQLSDPTIAPVVAAMNERFAKLGPDSTEAEIDDLVGNFVTAFSPIAADFAAGSLAMDAGEGAGLFAEHAMDALNMQQRYILAELERRLKGELAG